MYKKYQRLDDAAVDQDLDVVDFTRGLTDEQKEKLVKIDVVPSELIEAARKAYKTYGKTDLDTVPSVEALAAPCTVYEHKDFPGKAGSYVRSYNQ